MIMLLGALTGKINCSVIYLLMSFVGIGTMGGITVIRESVAWELPS